MNLKKLLVFTLISCMLFSNTVQASNTTTDTENEEDTALTLWEGTFQHDIYGTVPAKLTIESDNVNFDYYLCVERNENKRVGLFIVSDSAISGYLIPRFLKPNEDTTDTTENWATYGKYSLSSVSSAVSSYVGNYFVKDNGTYLSTYRDYWMKYLKQFGITTENYEEFKTWAEGKYFCYVDLSKISMPIEEGSISCPYMEITESEIGGDGYVATLRELNDEHKSVYFHTGYFDQAFFIPCAYGEIWEVPVEPDPDIAKTFICYRKHVSPVVSLSTTRVGKSIFTWKVEDYPEFADCYIEIKSVLLEGNTISGLSPRTTDYYWYSSVNSSNKKSTQSSILKVPFKNGTVTVEESDMCEYYKTFEQFKSIAVSCPIRMQVRVMSENGVIFSNWVVFDFDTSGQNIWTGIVDDNGNVITEGINNVDGYDWDADENSGKYGYGSYTDETDSPSFDNWTNQLKNALGAIGSFPSLLGKVFVSMPAGIETLIWASLSLVIICRILGR